MDILIYALHHLDGDVKKIDKALSRLNTEQVWRNVRTSVNSIGNLCLHLAGAEYQRVFSAIGGNPLVRERSKEFETDQGWTPEQLSERLHEVRHSSREVFANLQSDDLNREIEVVFKQDDWNKMFVGQPLFQANPTYEAEPISNIILGLVSHYSYHTGQIVILTKTLQDKDDNLLNWKH